MFSTEKVPEEVVAVTYDWSLFRSGHQSEGVNVVNVINLINLNAQEGKGCNCLRASLSLG
jgi:hypothetical protein